MLALLAMSDIGKRGKLDRRRERTGEGEKEKEKEKKDPLRKGASSTSQQLDFFKIAPTTRVSQLFYFFVTVIRLNSLFSKMDLFLFASSRSNGLVYPLFKGFGTCFNFT